MVIVYNSDSGLLHQAALDGQLLSLDDSNSNNVFGLLLRQGKWDNSRSDVQLARESLEGCEIEQETTATPSQTVTGLQSRETTQQSYSLATLDLHLDQMYHYVLYQPKEEMDITSVDPVVKFTQANHHEEVALKYSLMKFSRKTVYLNIKEDLCLLQRQQIHEGDTSKGFEKLAMLMTLNKDPSNLVAKVFALLKIQVSFVNTEKALKTESPAVTSLVETCIYPRTKLTDATTLLATMAEYQSNHLTDTDPVTAPLHELQTSTFDDEVLKHDTNAIAVESISCIEQDNRDIQTVENGMIELSALGTLGKPVLPLHLSHGQSGSKSGNRELSSSSSAVSGFAVSLDSQPSQNSLCMLATILTTPQSPLSSLGRRQLKQYWEIPPLCENKETSIEWPPQTLSVDTYNYLDLSRATNNFDKRRVKDGGSLIGSGGYGDVYYARSDPGGRERELAVKKLKGPKRGRKPSSTYKRQFGTEVQFLTRFQHKNFVTLYGLSCEGPELCLVYEYLPNGTLKQALSKENPRPLTWKHRLLILRDVAEALKYLDANGAVHRDVKSDNILLTAKQRGKLADFGLSSLRGATTASSGSGSSSVVGTKCYMAPETRNGNDKPVVSSAGDVYALGMVIYETITGLPPTLKGEYAQLQSYVREAQMQGKDEDLIDSRAGQFNLWYFRELLRLAKDCTDDDPSNRPTASEALEILQVVIRCTMPGTVG